MISQWSLQLRKAQSAVAERGNVSKSDLLQKVEESRDVRLRFGVAHRDGENSLIFLDGESGTELDQQEERTWAYDDLSLFDRIIHGSELRQFIEDGAIALGGQTVSFPAIGDTANWTRHPSLVDWGLGKFSWPTVESTLLATSHAQLGSGLLIGRDSPSFQSYHAAIAAFLGIDLMPGRQFNRSDISLRHHDRSGRITNVVWSPTTIDVVVEGDALANSVIELASPIPGEEHSLSEHPFQTFRFDIPGTGLPSGSWLVLRRDGEWMDYKFLNWPYALGPDSGVEKIVEEQDEIQSLISQGEGSTIEFKEDVPSQPGKERYGVCKTVAAFANGLGGTILLGVRDDGTIKGVSDAHLTQSGRDAIINWIKNIVDPLPVFDVRSVEIHGNEAEGPSELKSVILITVEKGTLPPHCIKPDKPECYIRRGASTFPAAPNQIRGLVLESFQTPLGSVSTGFLNLASG